MGRHPHRNGRKAGRNLVGDDGLPVTEDGKRTGPEGIHQGKRLLRDITQRFKLFPVIDMNDQRIIGRAALGSKNGENRFTVQRVCAKAVDGFGRECDKPAAFQDIRSKGICICARGEQLGVKG